MLTIYMGWDRREALAYDVAKFSIRRRSSQPVEIRRLGLEPLRGTGRPIQYRDGNLWCPISEAPMATEFAISRFFVPFLCQKGLALFVDCDVLCQADIGELFALADPQYAVQVVKHDHKPAEAFKMDGQTQTSYPRKNWSSVVLWNCEHPSNKLLGLWELTHWPGRDLHGFQWLKDEEIGELPLEWNWLVGVNPRTAVPIPKLLHYTLGGPWFPQWQGGPEDDVWNEEHQAYAEAVGRD